MAESTPSRNWFQSRPTDAMEAGLGPTGEDHVCVPHPTEPLTWVLPADEAMLPAVEAISREVGEVGMAETLSRLGRVAPGRIVGLLAGVTPGVRGATVTAEQLRDRLARAGEVAAGWPIPDEKPSLVARHLAVTAPASRPLPPGHVAFLLRLRD